MDLINLTASVVALCDQYTSNDDYTKRDISRVASQVYRLREVLEKDDYLVEIHGSHISDKTADDIKAVLVPLQETLENAKGELSMTEYGLRSFTWPIEKEDVNSLIAKVDGLTEAVLEDYNSAIKERIILRSQNLAKEEQDEPLDSQVTFDQCLSVMSSLKQDICDLRRLDVLVEEVGRDSIQKAIPHDLQYACHRWIDHLLADMDDISLDKTEDFLQKHVLYWFEAMSLLGSTSKCIVSLKQLHSTVLTNNSHPTLSTLLYDSWRFILRNHSTIRTAPLQTYSALVFSPQNSILRKSHDLPSWLSPTDSINADWDPALLSIQAHHRNISSTAFSPDGKWIASASYDQTVKVWNANTGTLYRTLEGPDFLLGEVLFLDTRRVACKGLITYQYCVWDLENGMPLDIEPSREEEEMFKRRCPVTSPDGSLHLHHVSFHARFIGPTEGPVNALYLKDAQTGEILSTLRHGGESDASAFSPDNKLIVSDGSKGNVHLWDATVPNSERTYESHSEHVFHVASSASCELVASASKDKTVRLWDPISRRTRHVLSDKDMKAVWIVEFSPDGKSIATGSEDSTIRLWDTATGSLIRTFDGHSKGMWALAFSDDGSRLVSASIDSMVIVWNVATGDQIEKSKSETVNDDIYGNPHIGYNENFEAVIKAGVLFDGTTSYAICRHHRMRLLNRKDWKESKTIQFQGVNIWSRVDHKKRTVLSRQGVLQYQAPPGLDTPSDLQLDNGWVSWKGTRLLKLPEGNIPSGVAAKDNVLAMGYEDGEVRFITIKPEEVALQITGLMLRDATVS